MIGDLLVAGAFGYLVGVAAGGLAVWWMVRINWHLVERAPDDETLEELDDEHRTSARVHIIHDLRGYRSPALARPEPPDAA